MRFRFDLFRNRIGHLFAGWLVVAVFALAASILSSSTSILGADDSALENQQSAAATISNSGSNQIALEIPARLEIDEDDVRPHVEVLAGEAYAGRAGKTGLIAATYLADQFRKIGLEPLFPGDNYFQEIPSGVEENGIREILGRNIGAWLPGSDEDLRNEFIIISAHYDHLGVREGQIYFGADDNATGTSMLLETARHFAQLEPRPRRSLVFVGFDLEENMLWGSRWFANHPPWEIEQVKLFITADMIGRSLGNLPLPVVFVLGSEHSHEVQQTLEAVPVNEELEIARLGIDLIGTRSDYGPFRDREIPFLFFSTGEHPDYHTPRDTPDQIDYEKLARISSLIAAVAYVTAQADVSPRWVAAPEPGLSEPESLKRITGMMIDANTNGQIRLSGTQELFVTQVYNRATKITDQGTYNLDERRWLIWASRGLLLSVF